MKIVVTEMPKHPKLCPFVSKYKKNTNGDKQYKCSLGKKQICENVERCRMLKPLNEIRIIRDII